MLVIVLSPLSGMAMILESYINEQGRIFLKSDVCSELNAQIELLERASSMSVCGAPIERSSFLGLKKYCEMDITDCLSPRVFNSIGAYSKLNGPNCWNHSLVQAGLLTYRTHTTDNTMSFFMSSPLCRRLGINESPQFGDIGAIRRRWGIEHHGFVYLNEDLVYTKNNSSIDSRYKLMGLKSMYIFFKIDDEPSHCLNNQMDKNCSYGVLFFRCTPMKTFLNRSISQGSRLNELLNILLEIEKRISVITISGQITFDPILNNGFGLLEKLKDYIENSDIDSKIVLEDQIFILKSITYRVEDLIVQIEIINKFLKKRDRSGTSYLELKSKLNSVKKIVIENLPGKR